MTDLRTLVADAATHFGLNPAVVQALVTVESGWNPWAWNPEPGWRYYWNLETNRPFRALTPEERADKGPPEDFTALAGDRDQEWWGQAASWGLMQVMGGVARERGYRAPYLTALCDPTTNVEYGCRQLAAHLQWAKGNVRAALAAFNGGRAGNAPSGVLRTGAYADKVLRHVLRQADDQA